jgi:hypothetical protein
MATTISHAEAIVLASLADAVALLIRIAGPGNIDLCLDVKGGCGNGSQETCRTDELDYAWLLHGGVLSILGW